MRDIGGQTTGQGLHQRFVGRGIGGQANPRQVGTRLQATEGLGQCQSASVGLSLDPQDQTGRLRGGALGGRRETPAVGAGLANELLGQVGCAQHLKSKAGLEKLGKWLHRLVLDVETAHDRKGALQLSRDRREQDI